MAFCPVAVERVNCGATSVNSNAAESVMTKKDSLVGIYNFAWFLGVSD